MARFRRIRGCTGWRLHRDAGGRSFGIRSRRCGHVIAEVRHLGPRRFEWGIYIDGEYGRYAGGEADSLTAARDAADGRLERYGESGR